LNRAWYKRAIWTAYSVDNVAEYVLRVAKQLWQD